MLNNSFIHVTNNQKGIFPSKSRNLKHSDNFARQDTDQPWVREVVNGVAVHMKQPRWSWTENNGNVHGSLRWWEIQDKSTINCWVENDKSTIQDKSTINPLSIHYQ